MKFLFISTMEGSPWGGSEELWFRSALFLLSKKHSIMVSVKFWENEPLKLALLRNSGALIIKRKQLLTHNKNIYSRVLLRISRSLKKAQQIENDFIKFNPDIICISQGGTFDFLEPTILKFLEFFKKPNILISQFNFETGHILQKQQRVLALKFINQASGFFFVSERNQRTAERQLACSIPNSKFISNPVTISSIGIKKFNFENATLRMACVARFDCDFKGQDVLVQLLATPIWQSRDFTLEFYGSGPHRDYIASLIDFYKLTNKVIIIGHVENIEEIWIRNQILILPSLGEGTPLSMLEAMFSGRSVLATDVGDIGKYVINNQTGFLAQTASVNSLSVAFENLWSRKHELEKLGQNAFYHAKSITDLNPEETLANYLTMVVQNI